MAFFDAGLYARLEEEEARILASLIQQELMVRSQDRRPSEVRAG